MKIFKLFFLLFIFSCSNNTTYNLEKEEDNIKIENIVLLNEKVCLKEDKVCNYFYIDYLKSNLAWLNSLLENRVFKNRTGTMEEQAKNFILGSKELLKNSSQFKNKDFIDWSFMHSQVYLGQRGKVLLFTEEVSIYTGDSEPSYGTYHFNVDLEKEKLISLDDILIADKQRLVDKVKESYFNYLMSKEDWRGSQKCFNFANDKEQEKRCVAYQTKNFIEKNKNYDIIEIFNNLENFKFNSNELVFLFNNGEINQNLIELKIPYLELQDIIDNEFLTKNFQVEFPKKK